jgi:polyhydroxyalkanoate synthesis regulator phasin
MKDFASYQSKKPSEENAQKTADEWVNQAKAVAGKYEGKSENDLIKAIYAQAVEGKRNGTLTNEQIDAFYKQFSPMLDGAKRKRLQKLVAELKKM